MRISKTSKRKRTFLLPNTYTLLSRRGFTIIEILVVFALVAILSGVGLVSFVTYSRSQQLNQTANDMKLMISQARSSAQSTVKTNTDMNGDKVDCYNQPDGQYETLVGYSIVVDNDQLQIKLNCEILPAKTFRSIVLPRNISFTGASTCGIILFNSLTSQVSGAPCSFVISGYGLSKTLSIDATGNVNIN